MLIDPADPSALRSLVDWREKLMKPLAKVDGVAIIDSDPGGWHGSTNADFVRLLGEHRKMLDRVRPGIELIYWMHAGWQGWSRFYGPQFRRDFGLLGSPRADSSPRSTSTV